MANGDFVCASSDGVVRVFTRVQQRVADPEVLEVYETTVSSQALNKTQVGDVQKDSLPGVEALSEPGKEGQVKMVRSGETVEAHQYSTALSKWEKIGEVVGGVGSGQKKLYQGKEYDYVFDVDIADGVPPLKLPYNATENPYNAAQRFLEKNDLPLTYLDQIVGFIEKNSEAVSLGSSNEFVDPYTGASSYRPGGGNSAVSTVPATSAPTTSSRGPSAAQGILPQKVLLSFKQFNEQGARAKIEELNAQLSGTVS
jgi:phospholipase A-2-activating protein